MELSRIVERHKDIHTQKLYQPLRVAIEGLSNEKVHQMQSINSNSQIFISHVKNSQFDLGKLEQSKILQATLIPQNMHLVQTRNPLKRIKVRSRSYKAISVDEVVKNPINAEEFKRSIAAHPPQKKEIIYDYQPNFYQMAEKVVYHPIDAPLSRGRMQMRSRSLPYISSSGQSQKKRVQKVESRMEINKKMGSDLNSQTSIKHTEESLKIVHQNMHRPREKNVRASGKQPISDSYSDYYQNCNKYNFNKNFKQPSKRPKQSEKQIRQKTPEVMQSPRSNNYRYNLFSLLDEQTNTGCSTGMCTKNELIALKIKKKW